MGHFLNTGIYTLSLSKDQENYSLLFFCPMGPNQLTITPPFNSHCNPQYKSDQFPQPGYGRDRLRFSPPKTFQTTSSSFSGGHLQHKAVMNQLYSPFPWLKMLYCIKINKSRCFGTAKAKNESDSSSWCSGPSQEGKIFKFQVQSCCHILLLHFIQCLLQVKHVYRYEFMLYLPFKQMIHSVFILQSFSV